MSDTKREPRASDAFGDPVDPVSARGDADQAFVDQEVVDTSDAPETSEASETSGASETSKTTDPPKAPKTQDKSAAPQAQAFKTMPDAARPQLSDKTDATSPSSSTQQLGTQASVSSPSIRTKSTSTADSKSAVVSDTGVKTTSSIDHAVVEAIGDEDGGSTQKKADTHAQHRALLAESGTSAAASTPLLRTPPQPQPKSLTGDKATSTHTDNAADTARGADEQSEVAEDAAVPNQPLSRALPTATPSNTSDNTSSLKSAQEKPSASTSSSSKPAEQSSPARDPRLATQAMPGATSTAALDPLRSRPRALSTSTGASTSTGVDTQQKRPAQSLDEADVQQPVAQQALQEQAQVSAQATTTARNTRAEQPAATWLPAPPTPKSAAQRTAQDSGAHIEVRSQSDDDDQRVQPVAGHAAPRVRITQPIALNGFEAMRISNTPPAGIPQPVLLMLAADIYRMQNARQEKVGNKESPKKDQKGGIAALKAPNKKDATQKADGSVQGILATGVASDTSEGASVPHIALRAAIMTCALQQPTRTLSMFVMSDETPAVRFFVRDDEGVLKPQWIQKPADPDNEDAMFSLDPWVDFAETAWGMVHGPVEPSAEVADNTALAVKAMETLLGSAAIVQPVVWNDEARLDEARTVYDVARDTNSPSYTPTLAITDAQVDPRDGLLPSQVYGVIAFYVEAETPHVILLEAPSSDKEDQASCRLFDVSYRAFCRSVRALVTAIPDENSQDEEAVD